MKKVVLIGALVLSALAVFACKSQPKSSEPKSAEDELKDLYARYSGDLILEGARSYTVVSGDTLTNIAANSEYRSGFYYPIILLASRDVVGDVDKIEPGMVLILPDLKKNLDNPKSRTNIKQFLLEVAKIEDERDRPQTAEGLRKLSASL